MKRDALSVGNEAVEQSSCNGPQPSQEGDSPIYASMTSYLWGLLAYLRDVFPSNRSLLTKSGVAIVPTVARESYEPHPISMGMRGSFALRMSGRRRHRHTYTRRHS